MSENPSQETRNLLSSNQASDASLRPTLHPLVLLTISDYITRHTLRRQTQPILGALLGQQNGRDISIEFAFEARLVRTGDGSDDWRLDCLWFSERLQQYKEVHKAAALDLVGWWTLCPEQGPIPSMLQYHKLLMHEYNESLLLLGFHPQLVLDEQGSGGKLPLTIYESMDAKVTDDGKAMQIDGGETADAEVGSDLTFRPLAYEVVTGEAEMIGIDFVAKGGGNATAVNHDTSLTDGRSGTAKDGLLDSVAGNFSKGLGEEKSEPSLSVEEEERKVSRLFAFMLIPSSGIASLMTRANAIKMLHSRLLQLQEYLSKLPPSYLTDDSLPAGLVPADTPDGPPFSFTMIRSIQALTARLSLLIPADRKAFEMESQAQQNDVELVALLGEMGRSAQQAKELGGKWSVIDAARSTSMRGDLRLRWPGEEMVLSERPERDW